MDTNNKFAQIDKDLGISPQVNDKFAQIDSDLGISNIRQPDATDTQIAELSKNIGIDYTTGNKIEKNQSQDMSNLPYGNSIIENVLNNTPYIGNVLRNVGQGVNQALRSGGQAIQDISKNNILDAGVNALHSASGAADVVFSPITGGFQTAVNNPVGKTGGYLLNKYLIQPIANNLSADPNLQKFAMGNPRAEQVLTDALNVGTAFIGGKKVPEIAGVAEKGVNKIGEIAGGVTNKLLDSEKIMQRVGRVNPSKEIAFTNKFGETIGEALSKRQIFGDENQIVGKLWDRFTKSKEAVDTALASLSGQYKFKPIRTILNDLVEREDRVSTEGALSEDFNRIHELSNKYDKSGLNMSEINEVKRLYEKNVKLNFIRQNLPESIDRANNLDNSIRKWQVQKADDLGFKNLKPMNRETSIARTLANDIGDYNRGRSANNALSLTDTILLAGGDPKAISMFISKKFFGSKKIQSLIAKIARDKNKDIGEIKALFGETKGLPTKIPGQDYTPARPTGLETKYKQINLPEQVRSFDLGLNEIKNAKKGNLLSQEQLLQKSYNKDTIINDAKSIESIVNDLPKNDKGDLLNILKDTRPEVYKQVIETENANRYKSYQEIKDLPMNKKIIQGDLIAKNNNIRQIYGDNYLGFNLKNMVERANSIKYPLSEKLINNVDSLKTIPEKIQALQNISDEISSKKPFVNKQGGFISTGSKELDPLYKEAQKYRTAEEFVKAQGKIYYHGTNAQFDIFNPAQNPKDYGTWFTPSKDIASQGTSIIKERVLKPDIKLVTENQLSKLENTKKFYMSDKEPHEILLDLGYGGIRYGDGNIQLFNPEQATIDTSVLNNIWTEANFKASTKQGMSAINPLTVIGGATAIGAGIMSKKESK